MVRATLKELATIAVERVGGCLALAWEPGRIPGPDGRLNCFRFVHVIFRFRREAVAFQAELERHGFTRLDRRAIRERTVFDERGMLRGWAATAIVSPHYESPVGLHLIGIPAREQPGCAVQARLRQARMEAELRWEERKAAGEESREPTDRLIDHFDLLEPAADDEDAFDERLADRLVEADLTRLERELDAVYARRPGYFPTVAELYAYTERKRQKERVSVAELDTPARTVVIELHNQAVEAARPKEPNRRAALERDAAEVAQAVRPRRRKRAKAAEELELRELQVELRRKGLLPALSATEAVAEAQALAALRARVAG